RVAEECSPAGKDLLVRGLDMGVRSDDGRDCSIQKPADRDLLARSFSVHVDENIGGFFSHLCYCLFDRTKRILKNWLHKSPSLHVENSNFSFRRLQDNGPAAGRARRIIQGAEEPRFEIEKCDDI